MQPMQLMQPKKGQPPVLFRTDDCPSSEPKAHNYPIKSQKTQANRIFICKSPEKAVPLRPKGG